VAVLAGGGVRVGVSKAAKNAVPVRSGVLVANNAGPPPESVWQAAPASQKNNIRINNGLDLVVIWINYNSLGQSEDSSNDYHFPTHTLYVHRCTFLFTISLTRHHLPCRQD
jgi:hypothetical protein